MLPYTFDIGNVLINFNTYQLLLNLYKYEYKYKKKMPHIKINLTPPPPSLIFFTQILNTFHTNTIQIQNNFDANTK